MMRQFLCVLLLASGTGMFLPADRKAFADGRFLRGERWQPFALDGDEADFYVAPDGDDSWSGTIPVPNRQKTDGPFATIGRAQVAVRQLKRIVYTDKQEPIEKRWIGSPHKFGERGRPSPNSHWPEKPLRTC
jgi:hypothetical protein